MDSPPGETPDENVMLKLFETPPGYVIWRFRTAVSVPDRDMLQLGSSLAGRVRLSRRARHAGLRRGGTRGALRPHVLDHLGWDAGLLVLAVLKLGRVEVHCPNHLF